MLYVIPLLSFPAYLDVPCLSKHGAQSRQHPVCLSVSVSQKGRGKMLSKYAVEKYLHKSNERIGRRLAVSRKTGKSESKTKMKKLHFPGKCYAKMYRTHTHTHAHTCWTEPQFEADWHKLLVCFLWIEAFGGSFACGTQMVSRQFAEAPKW